MNLNDFDEERVSNSLSHGEAFVETLLHAYDPVKRHEYYIRTRQLKGKNAKKQADILTMDHERMTRNGPPAPPAPAKTPERKALDDAFKRRDHWQKEMFRLRKAGKVNSPEMDAAITGYFNASQDIIKLTPNISPG